MKNMNLIFFACVALQSCGGGGSDNEMHGWYNSEDGRSVFLVDGGKYYFGPRFISQDNNEIMELYEPMQKLENSCYNMGGVIIPINKNISRECSGLRIEFSSNDNYFSIYCTSEKICPKNVVGREISRIHVNKSGYVEVIYIDPDTPFSQEFRKVEGDGIYISGFEK